MRPSRALRRPVARPLAAAIVSIVSLCSSARPEEWPRYRGPRGDGVVRGAKLSPRWPAALHEAWRAEIGDGYSSPIALDGRVYAFAGQGGGDGGRETLTAFDGATGRVLWRDAMEGGYRGGYPGTRATPAIDGDRIYTLGGAGDLIARALATGKPLWRVNALAAAHAEPLQWGSASSPLVEGDTIYVQGGDKGPIALAVRKADGSVRWRSKATGASGYAAPVRMDVDGKGQLLVFAGNQLDGLDPATGDPLWRVDWETAYGVNAAQPVVRGALAFVSSAYGRGAAMLRPSSGRAEIVWRNRDVATRFNAAVLDGDTLFANSEGELVALSWPDGKTLWTAKKRELELGVGGSIVRVGDDLIAWGERGTLTLVRADARGYAIRSQVRIGSGSENWATPLLYRGRLYVKSEGSLVALDLP